jgi:hypothetical protein
VLSAVCSGVEGVVSTLVVSALVVLGLESALVVLVLRFLKCSSSLAFYRSIVMVLCLGRSRGSERGRQRRRGGKKERGREPELQL